MRLFTCLLSMVVPMREREETEAVNTSCDSLVSLVALAWMWDGMFSLATPQTCIGALNEEVREGGCITSS